MPTRTMKWAKVEYQPNLERPVRPVPLGIVAEELRIHSRSTDRCLIILGREPLGNIEGLQLENSWGPFRRIVTEWMETVSRSAREIIGSTHAGTFALDELSRRWNSNVYLTAPELRPFLAASVSMETYARRWYEEYIGDPFPRLPTPRRPAPSRAVRRRMEPWVASSKVSFVGAMA